MAKISKALPLFVVELAKLRYLWLAHGWPPVGRAGLGRGPMAVRRAVLLACAAAVLPTV